MNYVWMQMKHWNLCQQWSVNLIFLYVCEWHFNLKCEYDQVWGFCGNVVILRNTNTSINW